MAVAEAEFRVMASEARVLVVGGPPGLADSAVVELESLEAHWSRFVTGSDVDNLNRRPGRAVVVSAPTITLVSIMIQAAAVTTGRCSAAVLPALLEAGYPTTTPAVEAQAAVVGAPGVGGSDTTVRPRRGLDGIVLDRWARTITLPPGLTLDPGGIGKGLAADMVVGSLLAAGADGALVSIGGDLSVAGRPPGPDGWLVVIEDPLDPPAELGRIRVDGGGVATTSTVSRRWSGPDGTARHHLIDPETGAPSTTDLAAVTVVAPTGWLAEAHATGAALGGSGHLAAYAARHGLDAVGVTRDGGRVATDRLAALADPNGSDPAGDGLSERCSA
ncbi:MAG: FAD:protein FMN transferase [Acidimicrobiales bacterium]